MDEKRNEKRHRKIKNMESMLQRRWFSYSIATCSAVILYVLLINLGEILHEIGVLYNVISPIVTGVAFAYLMNPLVNLLEKKLFHKVKQEKTKHTLSVLVTIICVILTFILLLIALIPSLVDSFEGIVSNIDTYTNTIEKFTVRLSTHASKLNIDLSGFAASWDKFINDFMSNLSTNLMTVISASYNIGLGALNLVVSFILAIYFLLDKKNMLKGVDRLRQALLTDKAYTKQTVFWTRCHKILIRYITYNFLDALIIGSLNAIVMLVSGMPYAVLISVIVAITNLLPTFGPMIGAAIGGLILVLNNPMAALGFLILAAVLQTIDSYILKPKLFGGSLGVPAVWILITIIVGGKLFGVVGILLAIPFAAIFTFVYEESVLPCLQNRKQEKE